MRQLLFITTFTLFLFACKKNPDTQVPPVECKLKTISSDPSEDYFFNVKMDSDRITQLTLATDTQKRSVYEFNSLRQLVKREDFDNFDNLGSKLVRSRWENYYDQSNNLVKTFSYYQMYTAGTAIGLYFANVDSFKYSNGQLSEVRSYTPFNASYIYSGKTIYSWKNDDLISLIQYDAYGQISISISFNYDSTKENKYNPIFTHSYLNRIFEHGHQFEGIRRSKHILTDATEQSVGGNPNPPVKRTYTTTYNSNGFVKSIQEHAYGLTYYIYRFGYTCD